MDHHLTGLLLILIFVTKLKDLPALVDYEGNIILENPFLDNFYYFGQGPLGSHEDMF